MTLTAVQDSNRTLLIPLTYNEKFSILRSSKNAFLSTYLWIVGWVPAGQMRVFSLIALLTLPPAIKAVLGALKRQELLPAMTNNVLVVLLTRFLPGVGYIPARVFSGQNHGGNCATLRGVKLPALFIGSKAAQCL
jgi:hypothetical protein